MAVSVLVTMLFAFAGTAGADSYTMVKGSTRDVYYVTVGGTQYDIAAVQSNSDPSKVSHTTYNYNNAKRLQLTAKEVGSSDLVVAYYTANGSIANTTVSVTVTYDSSSATNTRTVNLSGLNDYYTSTEKFTNVWDASFTNANVATYSYTQNSSGNALIITGKAAGNTTFTFWSTDTSGNNVRYTYNITVGNNTGANTTKPTVNMKVGEIYYIAPEDSNFQLSSSNTTNIATMSKTTDNRIQVTAVAAGSVNLQYSYYAGGNIFGVTVPISVSASSSTPATNTVALTVGQTYSQNFTTVGISTNSNASVATAKINSVSGGQQLVITGVAAGSTTITLVYTSGSTSGTQTLTVNVTGTGGGAGNSATTGIYFKSSSINIPTAKKYRISGIKLNGAAAKASELLWISTDTTIVAVGSKTGIFQGKKAGTARIIAVDPSGKYVNSVAVTVK